MTPSTDNFAGVIALILFVIKSLWDIYREKNKPRIDNAQAVNLDAQAEQLRDQITKSVLATARQEIDRHTARIAALESELTRAQELIGQLQTMLRERDQAVANLQYSVSERDTVIAGLQTQITELKRGQNSGGVMR